MREVGPVDSAASLARCQINFELNAPLMRRVGQGRAVRRADAGIEEVLVQCILHRGTGQQEIGEANSQPRPPRR